MIAITAHSMTRAAGAMLLSVVAVGAQSQPARVSGDVTAGTALFEGAGTCSTCHSIDSSGRRRGPNLSWIGMMRSEESLRHGLASHRSTPSLSAADIDNLVAYLRTLRSIPPSHPRERTRSIPAASENVAFFDRPEREAEERSDALVESLGIQEGSTIADIGAGTGYFTWRLARRAGPAGRVIAVDIQQRMLDRVAETARQHGLVNVDYILGKEADPRLPPGSLDLVFIAHSYHEFPEPEAIMEAIRRSLKPTGRLVIVEYAKENARAPAAPLHKMSFDEIREEIEPIGFDLDRILDFLPVQHGLIFTVR
jgi:precorrin-6B methylase 2/mono/diheme cytochrome c family protein